MWPGMSEGVLEVVATQGPDYRWVELLRSLSRPVLKPVGDPDQHLFGLAKMGVQAGQRDGRLTGVFRFATDRGHLPRPAGDRLPPGLRIR